MDLKMEGVSFDILRAAVAQAREGRLHVLEAMAECIAEPRESLSQYAPRIFVTRIPVELIGDIIGPGGKTIRGIIADTGAQINVDDDGTVTVSAVDPDAAESALDRIENIVKQPEVGEIYEATVKKITDFGAFLEFLPGRDGLLHISEIEHHHVDRVVFDAEDL